MLLRIVVAAVFLTSSYNISRCCHEFGSRVQTVWNVTDLQLIYHAQALIYTPQHDGEIKRAVKGNTTLADFMEFDKVKPTMDEIEMMLDKKRNSKGRNGTKEHMPNFCLKNTPVGNTL